MTNPTLERAARSLAHSDYMARVEQIKASQSTAYPISSPGPFDGLEYLIHERQWDATEDSRKQPYRRQARVVLMAVRPVTPEMLYEAGLVDGARYPWEAMIDAILDEDAK